MEKGSILDDKSLKSWLQGNGIGIYSAYYGRKFVVAEICIRKLEK